MPITPLKKEKKRRRTGPSYSRTHSQNWAQVLALVCYKPVLPLQNPSFKLGSAMIHRLGWINWATLRRIPQIGSRYQTSFLNYRSLKSCNGFYPPLGSTVVGKHFLNISQEYIIKHKHFLLPLKSFHTLDISSKYTSSVQLIPRVITWKSTSRRIKPNT